MAPTFNWCSSPCTATSVLAEIALDPRKHRTGDHWHIQVIGLPAAFRYGWRVDGPLGLGHRFNANLILLDPACTALAGDEVWGANSTDYFDPKPACTARRAAACSSAGPSTGARTARP